jgi:hypothetical protein
MAEPGNYKNFLKWMKSTKGNEFIGEMDREEVNRIQNNSKYSIFLYSTYSISNSPLATQ